MKTLEEICIEYIETTYGGEAFYCASTTGMNYGIFIDHNTVDDLEGISNLAHLHYLAMKWYVEKHAIYYE